MDSVSQFVLGASVTGAVLGSRTVAWRAWLWGGFVATLPDLDVLLDHGDAVRNMVSHRAESHALFWQTLVSPLLAFVIAWCQRERALFLRWWLAVWLSLVTHALLDAMTIYGTRLWLPFHDHPVAVGSLFVIDPLYTLPLLVGGVVFACSRGSARGRRWNLAGLWLSTLYAGWSLVAQQLALAAARESLAARGIVATSVVVTPAPLQTLLWRIVALTPAHAYEGFWSLCDDAAPIELTPIERGAELRAALAASPSVQRLVAFSQDACKLQRAGDEIRIADLRMGQEPFYVFTFAVGDVSQNGGITAREPPAKVGERIPFARALPWLWRRTLGERLPPPR
jgi:inner membrane protein